VLRRLQQLEEIIIMKKGADTWGGGHLQNKKSRQSTQQFLLYETQKSRVLENCLQYPRGLSEQDPNDLLSESAELCGILDLIEWKCIEPVASF